MVKVLQKIPQNAIEFNHEREPFQCSLTTADEPRCEKYARVTVIDSEGELARGCAKHAVCALFGVTGLRVIWEDSHGLNEWEQQAIELAEERNRLARHETPSYAKAA